MSTKINEYLKFPNLWYLLLTFISYGHPYIYFFIIVVIYFTNIFFLYCSLFIKVIKSMLQSSFWPAPWHSNLAAQYINK